MVEKWRWLGNISIEDGIIRPFFDKNPLLLTLHVKSVFRTQQQRSYQQSLVEREDIWDSKNAFRNEVSKIIMKEN